MICFLSMRISKNPKENQMECGNISKVSGMFPRFFVDSLPICQIEIDMDVVFVDSIRSTNIHGTVRIFQKHERRI